MNDAIIISTAILISASCGLVGVFLILRKMAMIGDAISHAVLPGIVLAFLFSGSRESLPVLIGAVLVGVLATVLIELFHKKARLQEDASIGVTFTWLFAIGVILISLFSRQVDLDQDCVLYGEIAYVPLDVFLLSYGSSICHRALWIGGGLLIIVLTFIIVGYKALQVTSFNQEFAAAIGLSTMFWHYALMSVVSMVTVASFEVVGAILVVALLVGPAATAYLLSSRLPVMLVLTVLFGILSSITGYYLAKWINGSIAGAIATMIGFWFGVVFVYSLLAKRMGNKVVLDKP
jgi:manganese/zinc/iron transport system permease protein